MITTDTLQRFLREICGAYVELEFAFESSETFEFVIRCTPGKYNEDYKGFCKAFVDNFSSFTNTNWIVRSSYPSLKRLSYRKQYKCQHSSFNKKCVSRSNRERARSCNATIDLTFKKVNKNTLRNDKYLKEGLSVVIKVHYYHSHKINAAEAYSFLRSSDDTDDCFKEYFNSGITPAAAIVLHEMSIIEKYGKESSVHLANPQINPSERHVYYLYTNWRKSYINDTAGLDIREGIESRLTALREKDFIFEYRTDPITIIMISPTMQRIYENNTGRDILYIDTMSSCDQSNTYITAVFALSKVGVLPIAFALHSSQITSSYTLAFTMIKEAFEKKFDGKEMNPAIIITDNNTAERNALKLLFPKCQFLLCSFHVAQSLWRWLSASENGIHVSQRPCIMSQFTKIMFANTKYEAEKSLRDLNWDGYVKCCRNFVQYLYELWDERAEWCKAYRNDTFQNEYKIKYTEASIRIFKDVILQRCKSLSLFAMVDFLSNILEKFQLKRFFKFAHNREIDSFAYLKFCKQPKDVEITRVNDTEFLVESTTEKGVKYTVNMEIVSCSCIEGQSGVFCKHLCAVELKYDVLLKSCPELSSIEREIFAKFVIDAQLQEECTESADYPKCSEHPPSLKHSVNSEQPECLEYTESPEHPEKPECPEHPECLEHLKCSEYTESPGHSECLEYPKCPEHPVSPKETYEFIYDEDSKDELIIKVKEEPNVKPKVEPDIEPDIDLNSTECLATERKKALPLGAIADPSFEMSYYEALTEMVGNINKLKTIFKSHPCWSNLEAINLFNKSLKNVTTDEDVQDYVFNNFKTGHPLEMLDQTPEVPKWKRKHEEAFGDSN